MLMYVQHFIRSKLQNGTKSQKLLTIINLSLSPPQITVSDVSMKCNLTFGALFLYILILPFAFASSFSWLSWTSWSPFRSRLQTLKEVGVNNEDIKLISHQAEGYARLPVPNGDYYQYPWTRADGTPLPFNDWFDKPPIPTIRSRLTRYGALVACWPSSGGIWIKHADPVEMKFLGLDRFRDTKKMYDAKKEDDFCTSLKMTGANWWSLPLDLEHKKPGACETIEACFEPDIKNKFLRAWPEDEQGVCFISIERAKAKSGELMGGWYNAMSMAERCAVIDELGGSSCDCETHCQDLQDLDWGFRDSACHHSWGRY